MPHSSIYTSLSKSLHLHWTNVSMKICKYLPKGSRDCGWSKMCFYGTLKADIKAWGARVAARNQSVFWQQVLQIAANRSEWQKIVSGRCWDNCSLQSILNLKLNTSLYTNFHGWWQPNCCLYYLVVRKLVFKWVSFRNKFLWNKNKMFNFYLWK